MRWRDRRRSSNIEDRRGRGRSSPRISFGKTGGIGVIIALIAVFVGGADPSILINAVGGMISGAPTTQTQTSTRQVGSAEQNELAEFVSVVLADTEDTWHPLFKQQGLQYREPKLVLFSGSVQSACGFAQSAMGPFYCPGDQKVYIDLGFYRDLKERHNAPGDFAQAYVIAHEVGHHIQTITGISRQVRQAQQRVSKAESNQLQVRMELQADCYAGVWAHHTHKAKNILERGDIEEALNAASQIGDDTLQRQAQGYVVPESFTHGSAKQRMEWFKRGIELGSVDACDTFSAKL